MIHVLVVPELTQRTILLNRGYGAYRYILGWLASSYISPYLMTNIVLWLLLKTIFFRVFFIIPYSFSFALVDLGWYVIWILERWNPVISLAFYPHNFVVWCGIISVVCPQYQVREAIAKYPSLWPKIDTYWDDTRFGCTTGTMLEHSTLSLDVVYHSINRLGQRISILPLSVFLIVSLPAALQTMFTGILIMGINGHPLCNLFTSFIRFRGSFMVSFQHVKVMIAYTCHALSLCPYCYGLAFDFIKAFVTCVMGNLVE